MKSLRVTCSFSALSMSTSTVDVAWSRTPTYKLQEQFSKWFAMWLQKFLEVVARVSAYGYMLDYFWFVWGVPWGY